MERLANLLQRFEVDPESFAFLQAPKCSVADASLFSQPVESPTVLRQLLVYSCLNHKVALQDHYLSHAVNIVYLQYILHLTYRLR